MDTLEQDYLNAVLPDVTYIFGRRLRSFSLAHWVTLSRLESPFLNGENHSFKDLLEAVWILTHTYEEITEKWHPEECRHQALAWYLKHTWLGLRGLRYAQYVGLLQKHVDRGFSQPYLRPSSESEGEIQMSSPMSQILTVHLMEKAHQSLSQVMNQPLPLSYWIYSTLAEKTGSAEITTAAGLREESEEELAREQRAEQEIAYAIEHGGRPRGVS